MAVLGFQAPALAAPANAAATAPSASSVKARVSYEASCATPKPGDAACYSLRRTDVKATKGVRAATDTPAGVGASDLQSAYNLPADGGAGQTVAIVDAYDDPTAESDLAVYRQQYGLPACTSANGCLTKVSQRGGTDYPQSDAGWAGEISLDLDMVSAAAPNAHILLVEADDPSFENLGAAVDEAVALGAKFVSNSYGTDYRGGGGEDPSETTELDAYYNHPGVAVVASTGDYGYGVGYPAASQYVTAAGGTSLTRDTGSSRGWSESAWNGAGSGCSAYEPKPAFQKDTGCANRALADVSSDSDPATGVSVYQTFGNGGWAVYGGTSAASPLIAATYAAAGTPVAGTYPNAYPYAGGGSGLNDVSGGSNGSCSPSYLCNGGAGYDGPTGLGSPNGLDAFRSGPHGELSGKVTDAGTGKAVAAATVTAGGNVATTGTDGSYKLTVPAGTYDITVDAFGYTSGSASSLDVADGATLTKDFSLTPVPSQTVSGKVTDGSGHGWPLYAKITVDGAPGAPVWTDPATGAYDLSLPQGHDYTLHVAATTPGYHEAVKTISVGDAPVSAGLSLKADPFGGTTPGYTSKDSGTTEPFDSTTSAPDGWKVVSAGDGGGWVFNDPGNRGNTTGGSGAFAIVDSDNLGNGETQDTQLISPAYDFSDQSNPLLSFATDYRAVGSQTASVDASTDGGATWKSAWSTVASVSGPTKITVPLDDYANTKGVTLRFHFTGSFGWWWQVDNVLVGQRTVTPTPGGLFIGNVTDANTGDGLSDAIVSSDDDPAVTTSTVATPDDPAVKDGFYSVFSPDLGKHSLTAAKGRYTSLSKSAKTAADSAVSVNFKLAAGQLTVTPGTVDKTVAWGGQATQKLTVKNTGGTSATLKVSEAPGTFQAQNALPGAPLQKIKGSYSPEASRAQAGPSGTSHAAGSPSAKPADSPWQSVADSPETTMGNVVAVNDGTVYSGFGFTGSDDSNSIFALDPAAGSWTKKASAADKREAPSGGFIDGKLYVVGGWATSGSTDPKLEVYDPGTDSWSTGASAPQPLAGSGNAVLDGKLYVIGGCTASCGTTTAAVYDPSSDNWSAIAAYPEPVAWESCGGIGGELYCAGGTGGTSDIKHAYSYDPASNSWSPVADLPAPVWGSAYASANGQLVISGGVSANALTNQSYAFDPAAGTWADLPNSNVATYRGGGSIGFYKIGGGNAPNTPSAAAEFLPGYDQGGGGDVTWLSESATQLTIQPGASATLTVSLDASVPEVTQPGAYQAGLTLGSDTPYSTPKIPVTLHVNPPKTWGKITGTVLGTTATGTAPLAGATVQIDSWATTYTLKTAADGTYALWLDTRNNPLTVIVAKDGYQPTVTTVKLTKGATVTSNFTLKKQ
ncbi:carboxypeptidase regulatory-like domain-containing protein [Streptomyces sp. NBC_01497]|uniref:carboxypeptidase regulatory-like domain-containing protein n=1 Tax=Streptomyces sp. NBC_01497 TaxID=2903885 RepID=UPI002E303876|nr:carboxypeptidase regulatory-like domain-containing protein [Streptomyces sp. NBC_01497]